MIRNWHSLAQEVECLKVVSLGVFKNKISQTLVGVISEHFSHGERFNLGESVAFREGGDQGLSFVWY